MKQIKIASIVVSLSFLTLNSFTSQKKIAAETNGIYRWFEYDGFSDPYDPSSYSMIAFEPQCNSDSYLCSIYAEVDLWSFKPKYDNLFELGFSSSYFTEPYCGIHGTVKLDDF
jgi:hypothetical protein